MKQRVIFVVGADHKIFAPIVRFYFVEVMDFRAYRENPPQRSLGYQCVLVNISISISAGVRWAHNANIAVNHD